MILLLCRKQRVATENKQVREKQKKKAQNSRAGKKGVRAAAAAAKPKEGVC